MAGRAKRSAGASIVIGLGVIASAGVLAGAAVAGLAPGPWKLMSHGEKSGNAPKLFVEGRWTYVDEYGPASGVIERWPIPKRMAFVVSETPRQRVRVAWSALCYPNGERGEPSQGTASGVGTVTIYPKLYDKRVECDPYVVARLAKPGTVRIQIYAY